MTQPPLRYWNLWPLDGQAVPQQMSPNLKSWERKNFPKFPGKHLVVSLLDLRGGARTVVLGLSLEQVASLLASSQFHIVCIPFDLDLLIPSVCLPFCLFPAS